MVMNVLVTVWLSHWMPFSLFFVISQLFLVFILTRHTRVKTIKMTSCETQGPSDSAKHTRTEFACFIRRQR